MAQNIYAQKILILDFGSQVTQLIARRIREIGVYCELWPWDVAEDQIKQFAPDGIILSGGPESVTENDSPRAPQYVFEAGVPVLGICYGLQTMSAQLGGRVANSDKKEFGYAKVTVKKENPLFGDLSDSVASNGEKCLDVWMSHGDKVVEIPQNFEVIASTDSCEYAAVMNADKNFYGVQFHPEVTHTKQGYGIFENFVKKICKLDTLWTSSSIIDNAVEKIRQTVGNEKVILGLSGGVDSS
ncbi:MAG: glutamine-hydrolyzing GMP synthase, partial [Succinivibrionaceae bacterium]|nr:glutamine-hydrolyzing GMP synthase [Succinivibrionaceae bacterium]